MTDLSTVAQKEIALPQEVIISILRRSEEVAAETKTIVAPAFENRDRLREALLGAEHPYIEHMPEEVAPWSLAAVDGAFVCDSLFAGDLIGAIAVAGEGLNPAGMLTADIAAFREWSTFLNHDADLDRVAKAAMHAMELAVLGSLPHDLLVSDGSHQTPVISFNSAVAAYSPTTRALAVGVFEQFDAVAGLTRFCDPVAGANVVCCPKSDSSNFLARMFGDKFQIELPCNDKTLASLVLEDGEMIRPLKPTEDWQHLHVKSERGGDAEKEVAKRLHDAIEPLRQIGQGRSVGITYFKPQGSAVAIKMEFKASQGRDWGAQAARQIAAQCAPPHLQEPFPQFLVDQWAKSAGPAMAAQLEAVRLSIAETDSGFLEYLLRSYRTGG